MRRWRLIQGFRCELLKIWKCYLIEAWELDRGGLGWKSSSFGHVKFEISIACSTWGAMWAIGMFKCIFFSVIRSSLAANLACFSSQTLKTQGSNVHRENSCFFSTALQILTIYLHIYICKKKKFLIVSLLPSQSWWYNETF